MPPAAAHAPELAWFVADTPLPPSISGQTSLPAYKMGLRPLNKLGLPGAWRASGGHIGGFAPIARIKRAGPAWGSPALSGDSRQQLFAEAAPPSTAPRTPPMPSPSPVLCRCPSLPAITPPIAAPATPPTAAPAAGFPQR